MSFILCKRELESDCKAVSEKNKNEKCKFAAYQSRFNSNRFGYIEGKGEIASLIVVVQLIIRNLFG
jgi:hypothetical protein